MLLRDTHRLAEAEPLMRRQLAILERNVPPDDPRMGAALNNMSALLFRAIAMPRQNR